jgi:hypothetical protein
VSARAGGIIKVEVSMAKISPYLLDVLVGIVFILLPGIRGYSEWKIHEYALLLLVFVIFVVRNHKK